MYIDCESLKSIEFGGYNSQGGSKLTLSNLPSLEVLIFQRSQKQQFNETQFEFKGMIRRKKKKRSTKKSLSNDILIR